MRAASLQPALGRLTALAVVLAAWLGSLQAASFARHEFLAWGVIGTAGLVLAVSTIRSSPTGWLSPTSAYLSVFWLFHFGFIFTTAIFSAFSRTPDELPEWALIPPETTHAAFLSILFMAAVWLGADLSRSRDGASERLGGPPRRAPRLLQVGWVVMAIGAGVSVLAVAQVGLGTFFGSYEVFFEKSQIVWVAILVLTNGLILLMAGGLGLRAVVGVAAVTYVPMALLCLVAGSRTAPMFSAVGLAVALRQRGIRFSRTAIAFAVVGALVTIGAVQQVRQHGVSLAVSSRTRQVEQNPVLSGINEMGQSLRAVSASLEWIEGRRLFLGATYALPFIRVSQKIVGIRPVPPEEDPRFIAEQISQEFGPIGYSTVAEAYVNFAEWGVAAFALLWGLGLGALERWASRPLGLVLMGAVLVPMLINIRNSFIFVPGWIFIGVAPIIVARLIAGRRLPRMTTPVA